MVAIIDDHIVAKESDRLDERVQRHVGLSASIRRRVIHQLPLLSWRFINVTIVRLLDLEEELLVEAGSTNPVELIEAKASLSLNQTH